MEYTWKTTSNTWNNDNKHANENHRNEKTKTMKHNDTMWTTQRKLLKKWRNAMTQHREKNNYKIINNNEKTKTTHTHVKHIKQMENYETREK